MAQFDCCSVSRNLAGERANLYARCPRRDKDVGTLPCGSSEQRRVSLSYTVGAVGLALPSEAAAFTRQLGSIRVQRRRNAPRLAGVKILRRMGYLCLWLRVMAR